MLISVLLITLVDLHNDTTTNQQESTTNSRQTRVDYLLEWPILHKKILVVIVDMDPFHGTARRTYLIHRQFDRNRLATERLCPLQSI